MAEHDSSFDRVRAILGRLDNSIDRARSERLGTSETDGEHDPATARQDTHGGRRDADGSPDPAPGQQLNQRQSQQAPGSRNAPTRQSGGGGATQTRPGRNGEPTGPWTPASQRQGGGRQPSPYGRAKPLRSPSPREDERSG